MYADNPVEALAQAVYTALAVDLSPITYEYQTPQQHRDKQPGSPRERRPVIRDVTVVQFPQTWGSTALGFTGMGGAAMSTAYTTLVACRQTDEVAVYFDGRLAYLITHPNEVFREDARRHHMVSQQEAPARYAPQPV